MCPRLLSTSWNSDSTALDQFPPWEAAIKTGLKHPQSTHFFVIDKSCTQQFRKEQTFCIFSNFRHSAVESTPPGTHRLALSLETGLRRWPWGSRLGPSAGLSSPGEGATSTMWSSKPTQWSCRWEKNRITYFKCNTVLLCVSLGSLDGQCCWSILGKCNNNVGMIGKWSGKQSMEGVGSVLATKPTPAKSNWQIINQPLPWLPVWLVTTGSAKKTGTARNIHIGRHPNLRIALSVHWSSVKSYLHVHQVWPLLIEIPKSVRV